MRYSWSSLPFWTLLIGGRGATTGDPSKRRAGYKAGAGRIIVVEQTTDHLTAAEQTLYRAPVCADHLSGLIYFQSAESEGNAAGGAVRIERRFLDAQRPIGFFKRQSFAR